MKKVVVATVILLVIITAGILENFYVDKVFDALDKRLLELESSVKSQSDDCAEQCSQLSAWWEKRRGYMELFIYSPDVRNFSVALGETQGSLECADYQNALSKIQSLLVMSSNIHNVVDFNPADII